MDTAPTQTKTIDRPNGLEVFVKSLPFSTSIDEVEQFFKECGTVENINLLKDRIGRLKGSGFIRFSDKEAVQKALAKNGQELGGRALVIELAQPKEERQNDFRSRPYGNKPTPSSSVFVGNLSYSTTEDDLRKFFAKVGEVEAVRLAVDRDGSSKGFAHVDFVNQSDAQEAVDLSGQTLDDRALRIDFANAKREGGFRGGFHGGRGFGGRGGGSRGGFRERDDFSGSRGSRGGYSGSRGGYSGSRGSYSGSRGGYSGSRGGF